MHVKLLAFFSTKGSGRLTALPQTTLVGLRGHLVYHIRDLASQSAVKCGFKNATNVLGMTLSGPMGRAYNTDNICIPEKVTKMLHGRFVHVSKTLTDLQMGCRPKHTWRPGSAQTLWGSYSAPPNP